MQIAQEVRRVLMEKPETVALEHFELSWVDKEPQPAVTKEQATAESESRWFGMLGMFKKKTKKPPRKNSAFRDRIRKANANAGRS